MILIGYSGHAFVAYGIFQSVGKTVTAYCDANEKSFNPFGLEYLGKEGTEKAMKSLVTNDFFISIGDSRIRREVFEKLSADDLVPVNAVHSSAIIGPGAELSGGGIMISAGAILNPLVLIGKGAIINTAAVIEHECRVGDFTHIGPGAILCGNVAVGSDSFVGAGTVVRQGITIGNNVMIGAGSVVVRDIPDNARVMGCPAK